MPDHALPPGFAQQVDVFLSYARSDLATARLLADALKQEGVEVGMDTTHIVPGENDAQRLDALLIGSAKVVFLATPSSLVSPACQHELDLAARYRKPVIPVLVAGLGKTDLPEPLREIQYLRRETPELVTRLAAAIRVDLDWERRHADYERQAARGKGEVIAHRRAVQEAQDWLAARPANATPVSKPVRDLIARSRKRQVRNTRWALIAFGAAILAGSGGILQYQARLSETKVAQAETRAVRAQTEGTAAETRARLADLSRIRAAEVLMQEGERNRALSELVQASERLVSDADLDDADLDDVLISFERVLDDAFRLRRIDLVRDTVVSFGPETDIYLSHQHTGLDRLDMRGVRHHLSNSNGISAYAILVLREEDTNQDLVFWKTQHGLSIGRGHEFPSSRESTLAFIPNRGAIDGYRNWRTARLDDGRVLIAQSFDLDWDGGQDKGAYVFDHLSGKIVLLEVTDETSFDALIARMDGRNFEFDLDPTLLDQRTQLCAEDTPGTRRFRLAEAIVADLYQRAEGAYTYLSCQWRDRAMVVTTEDFASSVTRAAYVYFLDGSDDTDAPGDEEWLEARFVYSTALDTGEFYDYNIWDHVSVFEGDNRDLTIVTYARREIRIWYKYETHVFPISEDIHRIVAQAPGLAAAITARADPLHGSTRSLIQIDVRKTFSDFLSDTFPAQVLPASGDEPRHQIREPVCLDENDLVRISDGVRQWVDTATGITHVITDSVFESMDTFCIYPLASFSGYAVISGNQLLSYDGEFGRYMGSNEIMTALSGGAPPPLSPSDTSFWRNARSLVRIDWKRESDDRAPGPRAYEIMRSRDYILAADISPSGTRAVLATSDNDPSVNLALWSLAAGRYWRDLGRVHRWYDIDFPQNEMVMAGMFADLSPHRLLTLPEARALAEQLLNDER